MAVLKQVFSGEAVIGSSATSLIVTIPTIVLDKSILFFSINDDNTSPTIFQINGIITDTTTLTFERAGTGGNPEIKWYIVEFVSGVTVQRGTNPVATTTTNQTISAVVIAKTFIVTSVLIGGSIFDGDDHYRSELTTTTNLQLTSFKVRIDAILAWQVVEFTDSNTVQTGLVSIGGGSTSATDTITAVDLTKAWLLFDYKLDADGTGTDIGQKMIRGRITSTTELTFDRDNTGVGVDISWYLIEFADDTTVESAALAFGTGDLTKSATLSGDIVTGSSLVTLCGWYHRAGKTPHSAAGNPGMASLIPEFSALDAVKARREITGSSTSDANAFVVDFSKAAPAGAAGIKEGAGFRGGMD